MITGREQVDSISSSCSTSLNLDFAMEMLLPSLRNLPLFSSYALSFLLHQPVKQIGFQFCFKIVFFLSLHFLFQMFSVSLLLWQGVQ